MRAVLYSCAMVLGAAVASAKHNAAAPLMAPPEIQPGTRNHLRIEDL
jgi:hypothetical protein